MQVWTNVRKNLAFEKSEEIQLKKKKGWDKKFGQNRLYYRDNQLKNVFKT